MTGPYPPEYGAGPVGPQMLCAAALSGKCPVAVSVNAAAAAAISETAVVAARRRSGTGSRGGRSG